MWVHYGNKSPYVVSLEEKASTAAERQIEVQWVLQVIKDCILGKTTLPRIYLDLLIGKQCALPVSLRKDNKIMQKKNHVITQAKANLSSTQSDRGAQFITVGNDDSTYMQSSVADMDVKMCSASVLKALDASIMYSTRRQQEPNHSPDRLRRQNHPDEIGDTKMVGTQTEAKTNVQSSSGTSHLNSAGSARLEEQKSRRRSPYGRYVVFHG